jgi:signal peptidase I
MSESMEQTETSALDPPAIPFNPPPDPPTEPSEMRHTITEWAITILLLVFLTTALVQAFVIPTGSMEDTLLIGDHLLVDKLSYGPSGPVSRYLLPFREPQRGDIIVFRYPVDIKQTFVKRVIGLPGDHIRIVNKQLFRNGVKIDEPYVYHKTNYVQGYRDNFPSEPEMKLEGPGMTMLQNNVLHGDLVVPPGVVFAMGDNRDFSYDSRYWGFVPRDNIIGKPLIIYWSYAAPTDDLTGQSPVRHILDLFAHFFTRTRWNRTFMLIHGHHN